MALIITAIFLGGLVFFFYQRAQNIKIRASIDQCTQLMVTLKNILMQIQKHRGLTTAYLNNNDNEFKSTIKGIKRRTDTMWLQLTPSYSALIEDPLYEGVTDHWARLKERWPAHSIDNNIEQHNRLILNLICLIDSQAEDNSLFVDLKDQQGLKVSWKALLEVIEIFGQIRAIGTGVVSSGRIKAIERNKLIALVDNSKAQMEKVSDSFEQSPIVCNSDELKRGFQESTSNAVQLCELIEDSFVRSRVHNLSASQFFDLASTTIQSLSRLFDYLVDALYQEALQKHSWGHKLDENTLVRLERVQHLR